MSATGQTRAIVLGAGIGGLTAALALRRVGIEAVVFERASELRQIQVGGGFHLWANAIEMLRDRSSAERALPAAARLRGPAGPRTPRRAQRQTVACRRGTLPESIAV